MNEILRSITREQPSDEMDEAARVTLGRRRASAALTLLRLGERDQTFDALRVKDDPESLTQFVHRSCPWSVPPQILLDCVTRADARRQDLLGDERP
ncbi:MAG: hypothetical protein NTY19_51585 [Planctomycetota bacterium]|nr:hypothetical protein [Planctomycetota bacterium]